MSEFGGKAEDMCSLRVFRSLTLNGRTDRGVLLKSDTNLGFEYENTGRIPVSAADLDAAMP
jgi:hypothetical protein